MLTGNRKIERIRRLILNAAEEVRDEPRIGAQSPSLQVEWPVDCIVGPGLEGAIACQSKVGYVNGSRGCLAVNTTTELGNRDDSVVTMASGFRDEIRTGLRAALDRAAAAGEISADHVAHYAEILVAFLLSLTVFARGGADGAEIDAQFDAITSIIDSWRLAA